MKEPCGEHKGTFCVPCASGTYTAHLNGLSECLPCRVCDPGKNTAMLSPETHGPSTGVTAGPRLPWARPAPPLRGPLPGTLQGASGPWPHPVSRSGLVPACHRSAGLSRAQTPDAISEAPQPGQTPTGRGSRTAWPGRRPPAPTLQVLRTPSPHTWPLLRLSTGPSAFLLPRAGGLGGAPWREGKAEVEAGILWGSAGWGEGS